MAGLWAKKRSVTSGENVKKMYWPFLYEAMTFNANTHTHTHTQTRTIQLQFAENHKNKIC